MPRVLSSFLACLLLLTEISYAEEHLLDQGFELNVQLRKNTLTIAIRNVSLRGLLVYNSFANAPSLDGWPEDCYIQISDSEGRVYTHDKNGNDLWTPWIYWSQAQMLPVALRELPPGDSWATEVELKKFLKILERDLDQKREKPADGFGPIQSVRLFFMVQVDSMLSKPVVLYTDWIELNKSGWFMTPYRSKKPDISRI